MQKLGYTLAIGIVFALPACSGKDPYKPGDAIGTFHVTGKLVSTTCGATPDPWEFDVRLRHDATTIFWVQGDAPVSGKLDVNAHVAFHATDTHMVRAADAKLRTPACVVTRDDGLDVTLAEDGQARLSDPSKATTFGGYLVYRFTPTADSDCSDQLADTGGDFAALPCEVRYDVTALRTAQK